MGLDPSAAQNTRGVVDIPVPDFSGQKAAAQALGEVGKTMLEFGNRLQEAETDRKIVTATNNTRSELDKARRAVLEDPAVKPEEYETHYKKLSDEIIKRNGAPIAGSGSRAQAIWAQHTGDWQLNGTIQMRDATRRKQLETATAEIIATNASTLKQVGDLSLSEETVAANLAAQKDLNERQVMAGTLGKDDAVRLNLELDQGLQKDKLFRARDSIERLTMAGDDTGAEMMIAEFAGSAEEQKALKQAREATQQDLRAEKSRLEAETRKGEIKAANTFEMGVLTDGLGFKQLQAAVDKGEISINEQPALFRAIRAEQARKEAEAAASKLSEAAKNEWKSWSQQVSLELESSTIMTAAEFMGDPAQWAPDLYERYQHMMPEHKLAIDKKRLEMRNTGRTTPEIDRIEKLLFEEAKRIAPAAWAIASTAKDKTIQARELPGYLREAATVMAPETGGRDLTPDQMRSAAAMAIGRVTGGEKLPVVEWEKWSADAGVPTLANIYSDRVDRRGRAGVSDPARYDSVFAKLTKKYGGQPTMEQMQAGYKQAADALEGLK